MCLSACSDNVSLCVLLILSIVSSLIISPPPRHSHQLLRGAIIWNWFSPPTWSLAPNIKWSLGKTEEWKLMIKGCQHLKPYSSANSCERWFSLFPFLSTSVLFFFVDRAGGKNVGKLFLLCAFTCLWVSLGEEKGDERRETWRAESLPSYAKTPRVNKDTDLGGRAWELQSQKPWEIVRKRQWETERGREGAPSWRGEFQASRSRKKLCSLF